MAATKNTKEVLMVKFPEIPESICVETRFITQAAAKQKKNEQLFYVSYKNGGFDLIRQEDIFASGKNFKTVNKPPTVTFNLQGKQTAVSSVQQCQSFQQSQTAGAIVPLRTTLANLSNNNSCNVFNNSMIRSGVNTAVTVPFNTTPRIQTFSLSGPVLPAPSLGSNIIGNISRTFNSQVQQTDISAFNMKSVGIQCEMDDDICDLDSELLVITDETLNDAIIEAGEENRIEFMNNNSTQHKNYKECLICGEVFKSNSYFSAHMAIHQGPKILCYKCGSILDHNNLQHNCRAAKQLEKSFLQCPHHTCNVKAISRQEIFDHINEHTNNRMYKCSACRKSFCTAQEFLRHLLIRAKCYTSAKRKRLRVYGLQSKADRKCRVRVFTLHTFKKCTTLVKTFLSQRFSKQRICKICQKYLCHESVYSRHRIMCISKFRKRLLKKRSK